MMLMPCFNFHVKWRITCRLVSKLPWLLVALFFIFKYRSYKKTIFNLKERECLILHNNAPNTQGKEYWYYIPNWIHCFALNFVMVHSWIPLWAHSIDLMRRRSLSTIDYKLNVYHCYTENWKINQIVNQEIKGDIVRSEY